MIKIYQNIIIPNVSMIYFFIRIHNKMSAPANSTQSATNNNVRYLEDGTIVEDVDDEMQEILNRAWDRIEEEKAHSANNHTQQEPLNES